MLSDADIDLVARDRSLPGLGAILDTAAFTDLLRGISPTLAQATVHPTYVRYKPGTRCLVAYDVQVAERLLRVHANAYAASHWAERSAASERIDDGSRSTAPILVHDRALIVTVFPQDAKLPVLKRLWDPVTRVLLLRKLLPDYYSLHTASVETLAYNPERRFVGLLRGAGTLAVIKLYADGVFVQARAAAGKPSRSELLKTPRCIGRSRRHRALALEWLPGERLTNLLATSSMLDEHLRRAGSALAELHRRFRLAAIDAPPEERRETLTAARGIRALWPPLGDRVDRLASTIAAALDGATVIQAVHGDFYAAQVLVDADHIGILDLDRARSGDPMSDVGNFVAHLEYAAIDGSLSPTVRDVAIDAFIAGYEQTARISVDSRIHTHVAAGLLRLGARPFRTRATDWAYRMSQIVDRAELEILPPRHVPAGHAVTRRGAVSAPIDIMADHELGLRADALDARSAAQHFARLPRWRRRSLTVADIRVVRHKPGRRCLIEYDIEIERAGGASDRLTLIGKVKAKGADRHTIELTSALWRRGFHARAGGGISVPEPIGVLPEWKMWLQAKVAGATAGTLLGGPRTSILGRRAAEVIHKLQRTKIPSRRSHTAEDELRILRERLWEVASQRPAWRRRLEYLVDGCSALLASLRAVAPGAAHRDFHPGQLVIDGDRVHLLDLDLYATADPALDAGNFLAHVTECSLREFGDPGRLGPCEMAMMDRFLELERAVDRRRLDVYRLVSLARHVHISTRFPDRQAFTDRILAYCEDQLAQALAKGIGKG